MTATLTLSDFFKTVSTAELWIEIARRLHLRFGKIQISIHDGKPSKYATIDMRVETTN